MKVYTQEELDQAIKDGLIDFRGAKLYNKTFHARDLRNADFHGAGLCQSKFYKADLRGAVFDFADLWDTVFESCRLDGAHFEGAKLDSTRFKGSNLSNANFVGAVFGRNAHICLKEPWHLQGVDLSGAEIFHGWVLKRKNES